MKEHDFKTDFGVRYSTRPHAEGAVEVENRHGANRIAWNEAAAHYTASLDDTIKFLRNGGSSLHPVERANLGDLRDWCKAAIHLQCASGEDTLSLWNEGVGRVVGVDISDVHIANAQRMSEALDAPAEWYRCDLSDTPASLNGTADLVYTGQGALCWLHDLESWADTIHRLLKPGGVLHLYDDHPLIWLFDMEAETFRPSGLDYFGHSEISQGWPPSYIDDIGKSIEKQEWKYERLWTIAEVIQALIQAGLVIEKLGEHRESYYGTFPNLNPEERAKIPMTFSVLARKG
jgi:SAM-dependent methyltransferase